jgi:phenylpropionate dioxygenase-like ring-hydroxylating dioxygenase large terminal subunit
MRELDEQEQRLLGNATLMYVIFPSSCLFVEKDHANLIQILPEAVDRCRIKTTHMVRRLSPRLVDYWDANIDVYLSAVREDLDVCESMQRGFASAANEHVMFGRNELGCQMYRRCVEDVVAEATGAYAR